MEEAWPALSPSPRFSPCWEEETALSLLLALQPPLGSGQGHSQILAGGWGRDGEGETQLGTIAGSLRAGRRPQSTFL